MDLSKCDRSICVLWDDFGASLVQWNGPVGCVLAEEGAAAYQANAFFEAEIDIREFGLPGFNRDLHEAISEGKGSIGAITIGNRVCFLEDKVMPVRILAKVNEYPGSVDAGVELASKEGTDNKLG